MQILKIGDWIVIASVALATILLAIPGDEPAVGAVAFIHSDAGLAGPFALNEHRLIDYNGPAGRTTVELGSAQTPMAQAPIAQARIATSECRHQICVSAGWIRRAGEVAVCLPNGIILRLAGPASAADLDAISH
jgi:hypothetical protein